MDRLKAIEVLKPLVDSYVEEDDDIADALEMAVEALKALDVPDTNVGDMISRRAAIDALKEIFNPSITKFVRAKLAIENLPSAQPEQKWIPCSERFPEYNESVLTWDGYVFCIEKRIPYIRDDDGEPIEGDWWVDDEYDEYESEYYPNLRDGAAIAWMSLPEEPYRG